LTSTGFACSSEKTSQCSPALRHDCTAAATIGRRASTGSVTSSGRFMPSELQASGNSAMRPAPKRIEVG